MIFPGNSKFFCFVFEVAGNDTTPILVSHEKATILRLERKRRHMYTVHTSRKIRGFAKRVERRSPVKTRQILDFGQIDFRFTIFSQLIEFRQLNYD